MTSTERGPDLLQEYFDAGQHGRLAEALAEPSSGLDALERRRWEAALASRGRGPVVDLLVAARTHRAAATPHAGALAAQAARALRGAGFASLADELGADADAGRDGGTYPSGQAALAQAQALRAAGDLTGAAAASASARELLGASDERGLATLAAALDAWLVEDLGGARAGLQVVRDDTAAPGPVRAAARAALDAIDVGTDGADAGPRRARWQVGTTVAAAAAGALGTALAAGLGRSLPTLVTTTASHLRAGLAEAGVASVRVVLDEARLALALAVPGVVVVVEEETATGVGFAVVTGYDPVARLIGTWSAPAGAAPTSGPSDRVGARLRPWASWAQAAALCGGGALLVLPGDGAVARQALAACGLADDPRLELVDRAHFDPADPEVPHAHVAQLARRAIAVAPELPLGHRRLGEALLALGRLGRLDDDDLLLERWVAETRERFPDAEWPRQLYAEALELWRRWPEALVAWADASRIDGDDPRNHLGQVRGAREVGGLRGARHGLRRALRLDPGQGEAWAWLADEELASGDLDAAQAALDLAAARRPDAIDVLTRQATLAERRGEQAAAAALLERACLGDVLERGQTMRRWRHHLWAGEFAALQGLAERRLVDRYPSAPSAWSVMIDGALMVGDRDLALAAIDGALQRCVPSGELLDNMVEVLATVLSADELDPALRSLEHRLAGQSDPLIRIARGLGFAGHRAASVAALTRLCERYPHDANAPYSLAQILAGSPDAAAVAAPLGQALGAALALAEHFPWVRILLGWHQLATAPDEALRTVAPVADAVPALGWDLMARALAATGRADGAAELRARLPEVASAIPDQLGFLRRAGLMTAARELGAVALAAGELSVRLEHARTLAAIGATDEALTLVEAAYGADVSDPFVGVWLLKLAAQAGADFRVEDEYPSVVACCQADSQRFADPWIPIALAAGVGVDAARTTLAARAPHHLGALRQRARAARAVGAATAADDLAALATLAPGSASTIDHPEL